LLVVATLVLAADQATKEWALRALPTDGTPRPVIDGWFQLRLVFNPGAAFNLATGATWIFTVIASCVAVVILRVSRNLGSRGWAVALGLLLGGALGNLVDRLTRPPGFARGHVVDFLEYLRFPFMDFPVFNVADSCIVTAAILIGLLGFLGIALDGSREPAGRGARVDA
jgi:signal peptidase II